MKRIKFIRVLASLPLVSIPFRNWATPTAAVANCQTERDVEGPFYKPDAPMRSMIERAGTPLHIEGKVLSSDCHSPVADATLDIWHCDQHGNYDMQGYRGRGQVKTNSNGSYAFTTIFPPPYGSRPRHIHIKVRAKGRKELTTQLYFKGDPNIPNDFARNAGEDRVISLKSGEKRKTGVFNIYL